MSYIPSNQILSSAGCNEADTAKERIGCILEIMLEVELNQSRNMLIAGATYPTRLVRECFVKINSEHIRYMLDGFNANTTHVGNIKKCRIPIGCD